MGGLHYPKGLTLGFHIRGKGVPLVEAGGEAGMQRQNTVSGFGLLGLPVTHLLPVRRVCNRKFRSVLPVDCIK